MGDDWRAACGCSSRSDAAEAEMMMRKRVMCVAVMAAVCGAMSGGCSTMHGLDNLSGARSLASLPQQILGEWKLDALQGFDLSQIAKNNLRMPSINFAQDGGVSGFAGVNRFMGKTDLAQLAEGKFSLPNAASTKMAGPPIANELENKFLAALTSADGAKMQDGNLLLTKGGEMLMRFVK
ncbi:MAG TPA: META domain-containing protein [Phycisphaerales bacterium]|nr:META domain-containing protein [Phycisphaerales bacterium]